KAHGICSLSGDGQNIREVMELAGKAKDYILSNKKPFFLELSTYRYREHCGPNFDNNLGYRSEGEYEEWLKIDPIETYKQRLIDEGKITFEEIHHMTLDLKKEIDQAFEFAINSPFPEKEEAFKDVYATGKSL